MTKLISILLSLIEIGTKKEKLSETDEKHIRIINSSTFFVILSLIWWVPISLKAGKDWNAIENLIICTFYLLPLLFNYHGLYTLSATFFLLLSHFQLGWAIWWFGVSSGSHYFYAPLLLVSYAFYRRKDRILAHFFTMVVILEMGLIIYFKDLLYLKVELIPIKQQEFSNAIIATILLGVASSILLKMVDRSESLLEKSRAKADMLLLNVLPPSIAYRLKLEPNKMIADRYESVSILFIDLVGFTPLSEKLPPEKIVLILNEIFTAFDSICEINGVEKIRTIGDGYMAVCGAPILREDHAIVITKVAIEIRDYMNKNKFSENLQVRIGINTGTAIAAIVGKARFHFDLWGDAVNVAARMESLCEPGKIHIAKPTYELIKDEISCTYRGKISVKGKGEMETWFVD